MKKFSFWIFAYGVFLLFAGFVIALDFALPDGQLHVTMLNIGQGDAILITTPKGKHILVDGGPGTNILQKLPQHLPYFNNQLDLVVLTHAHADHIDGLIPVLQRYPATNVLVSGVQTDGAEHPIFAQEIQNKNVIFAQADQDWQIEPGVFLDVLYPIDISFQNKFTPNKDLNETSVMFRLMYGQTAFVFTGDAGVDEESQVLLSGSNVQSYGLKAGHHGSRYSTSLPFLTAIDPKVALISAGKNNSYKHPHPETLAKFRENNVQVYRTDKQGTIEITCNSQADCAVQTKA